MPGSAVSDLAGRVLAGRYLLHGAVGTGASGRVYVAEDTRLRRRVAVKVLHAALAEDAAFLRRFRAEAQLAAALHHPHIVTVHDWGDDDVPFMVLELLEGGSLRSMLDQSNLLTVSQAARVGRDVASALEYAPRARRAPPRHQAREPAVRRTWHRARRRLRSRRERWPKRVGPSPRARCSVPLGTRRPNRRAARNSTRAPISTHLRW